MPSPIEKLLKFIRLEANRGFDNRAVVGGLDQFAPIWENEARQHNISPELIAKVSGYLHAYPAASISERDRMIRELFQLLDSVGSPSITTAQQQTAPPPVPSTGLTGNQPSQTSSSPVRASSAKTPASVGLQAPLTVLPGIGPKNFQTFKELGLKTLEDLLYYFPRRYVDYSELKPINRIQFGEELSIIATVERVNMYPPPGVPSRGKSRVEIIVGDGSGSLRLTWFNQPYMLNRFSPGDQLMISGRVDMYLGRLVMNHPEVEEIDRDHLHTNRILPIYPLAGKVGQRWLRRLMYQTVTFWAPRVRDPLPASIRQAAGLLTLSEALQQAHFPASQAQLREARARLAFDEIFLLQLGVLKQKQNWQANPARIFSAPQEWMDEQISRLPFPLTNAQTRVIQHVQHDLASGHPMNRLLQGDVGSGKTVVAAMAALMVAREGGQTAFMAPTSILAEQHYASLMRMLTEPNNQESPPLHPAEIRLLVGDTSDTERTQINQGLNDGTIKLLIGTHALIEGPVSFHNLQLAIIDEQHRFGVGQRSTLRAKGENPHLLVMTATPIPRSLALTLYGDLDISVMDEMPPGRQPIETHVLPPTERERAYRLISHQVEKNYQAFIIYPLIEQGEREESRAAVEEHTRLQKDIFPQYRLALLHGRMRPDDKDRIMKEFRDGKYHILVSTSVIEVGVDVPNATVMLIEGADRFGLAQLHQFRGRVGRGDAKSYCLLIPQSEDAVENERLTAMAETNDGFILAERDLQQRGPGDFLGTRQSGFAQLRMANLTDVHLIEKAREHASALFEQDPTLSNPELQLLNQILSHFWGEGAGDIS